MICGMMGLRGMEGISAISWNISSALSAGAVSPASRLLEAACHQAHQLLKQLLLARLGRVSPANL